MAVQPNQISDSLKEIIQQKIPLHVVIDFLKKNDKQTANSWERMFAKNPNDADFFRNLLEEVLCFGKKTIFAYNIKEEDEATFNLDELDRGESPEINILNALNTESNHYIKFRKINDARFVSYTFICRKPAKEIFVLSRADLNEEARERYTEPDTEIRVTTNKFVTVFDSVIHDKGNNVVFFIVDNLRYSYEKSAIELHNEFRAQLMAVCPQLRRLEPIDFFNCISEIYNRNSEGIVHRLGFDCNTGAVRDERLKQGQLDLRNEVYHTSGKAAIGGEIHPYRLGITWQPAKYHELNTDIDLEIHGTRQSLSRQSGVPSFLLNSNVTFNELKFALNRIILYVGF